MKWAVNALESKLVKLPRVAVSRPDESSCDSSTPCTPQSLRSRSTTGTPLRKKLHSIAQLLHQHHIQSNSNFYKCQSGKLTWLAIVSIISLRYVLHVTMADVSVESIIITSFLFNSIVMKSNGNLMELNEMELNGIEWNVTEPDGI